MADQYITKDDGNRQEHTTGALRSNSEGRGRFELISPFALERVANAAIAHVSILAILDLSVPRLLARVWAALNQYQQGKRAPDWIAMAAYYAMQAMHAEDVGSPHVPVHFNEENASNVTLTGWLLVSPIALRRVAQLYERGAIQKGVRNWEKGFPISRSIDSASRHLNDYLAGERVEDNLAAFVWNLFSVMHFEEMVRTGSMPQEFLDLPLYTPTIHP